MKVDSKEQIILDLIKNFKNYHQLLKISLFLSPLHHMKEKKIIEKDKEIIISLNITNNIIINNLFSNITNNHLLVLNIYKFRLSILINSLILVI